MKRYAVRSVEAVRYAVLRLVFEDGLTGELDLTDRIASGVAFARLRDPEYFKQVAVADGGHAFGWNLDELGHEIDFCADSARIKIETRIVENAAEQYRKHSTAAE
jgi:hypothetical protein